MDHDKTSSNYRIWAVLSFKKINSGDAKTNPKTPLAQVVQPFLLITFPFVVLSQENILKKTEKWPWKYLQEKKIGNWHWQKKFWSQFFSHIRFQLSFFGENSGGGGSILSSIEGPKISLEKNLETTMIYNCKNANDRVCAIVALFAFFSSKLGLIMCVCMCKLTQ